MAATGSEQRVVAADRDDGIPVRSTVDKSHDRCVADVILDGVTGAAAAAQRFATANVDGGLSLRDTVDGLRDIAAAEHPDAVDGIERMLRAQARTLGVMFSELTQRAAQHLDGRSMHLLDGYLRLAFRAQDQARRTAETLASIRNPTSLVIAKSANVNTGQQVNVAVMDRGMLAGNADEFRQHPVVVPAERLDRRAACTPVCSNPPLATLDTVDRTDNT
jgi:hypothetical protein